ncbi:hypothetical protein JKP88DRAFT_243335 [Tribonema minus]|uniref:Uncharacterized protein n=1 Tax=Tribonema minus TaxID=303371 RepID=A0A835Z8R2_9STRA|nr:hypothetical protein JKP88DRAFT_243335 [Tribonema minus]
MDIASLSDRLLLVDHHMLLGQVRMQAVAFTREGRSHLECVFRRIHSAAERCTRQRAFARVVVREVNRIVPMRRQQNPMPPEWRPRRQRIQKHRKWRTNRRACCVLRCHRTGSGARPSSHFHQGGGVAAGVPYSHHHGAGGSRQSAARGASALRVSQAASSTATGIAATHDGNQGLVDFDRDRSGATNMGMRSVCAVCGVDPR